MLRPRHWLCLLLPLTLIGSIRADDLAVFLNFDLKDGSTTYHVPDNSQKVQIGANLDFQKFAGMRSISFGRFDLRRPAVVTSAAQPSNVPRVFAAGGRGVVYGLTRSGSAQEPASVVKITIDDARGIAQMTPVVAFDSATTGTEPGNVFIDDGAGQLLGVTRQGGAHGKGTIFRFTPANGKLTKVFDFPASLIGVANGLVRHADGSLYGITSILAEAESLEVTSPYDSSSPGNPALLEQVGDSLGSHGSIFRLTTSGSFSVLKSFSAQEAVAIGAMPPPLRQNPPPIIGSGPILPQYSGHTFFPCSLGLDGDRLVTWVSGGLYEIDLSSGNWQWLRPTAELEIANRNREPSGGLTLIPRTIFFGRVIDITSSGSTVVFDDEAPTLTLRPDGLYAIRDTAEYSGGQLVYPKSFKRTIAPDAPTTDTAHWTPFGRARNAFFPGLGLNKFRVDAFPSGGAAVSFISSGEVRPLADFRAILGAFLRPDKNSLLVSAVPLDGSAPRLYLLSPTTNSAPFAPDFKVAANPSGNDTALLIPSSGPGSFAADPNYDSLSIESWTEPAHGTVRKESFLFTTGVFAPDHLTEGFVYTPATGAPAIHDQFTYTLRDPSGAKATGTIFFGNVLPIARPDTPEFVGLEAGGTLLFRAALLRNDSDGEGDDLAAFVALDANDPIKISKDGEYLLLHVPAELATTTRTIPYALTDGYNLAVANIVFGNPLPVVANIGLITDANGIASVSTSVLARDPEGDPLTFRLTTPAYHGTVVLENEVITYTAQEGYAGPDSFGVEATDPGGATVALIVRVSMPYTGYTGPLTGLVSDGTRPVGLIRMTLTRTGKSTVRAIIDGRRYSGQISGSNPGVVNVVLRSANGGMIRLQFTLDDPTTHAPSGTVKAGDSSYPVDFSSPASPLVDADGQFNVLFTGDAALPARSGFAIVQVRNDNSARLTGRMPDGRAWSFSGALDGTGHLAVFTTLGRRDRSIGGTLHLDDLTITPLAAAGSLYEPPDRSSIFGGPRNVHVELSPARLAPISGEFSIDDANRVTRTSGRVNLTLMPATGLFRGTSRLNGHDISFLGLLQGNTPTGTGPLLSGRQGSVTLQAATGD
jgi:uncharacterized repeat protein (TIGR03803 family)